MHLTSNRLDILGVPVDLNSRATAESILRGYLAEPWDGRCRHVVTLNPEYVMGAQRDPSFAKAISDADLVLADGVGVTIAARLLGHGLEAERFTGVDLLEWLAALGAPLYLLGGGPGIAAAAGDALPRARPSARIVGAWSEGTPDPRHDGESLARIAASGARALAVAYGAPAQVVWLDRHGAALAMAGVRLAIGVGGAFDYLAGATPRAPRLVRRVGLEWLYRLANEPRRWRRQTALPSFALRVLIEWLWRRGNRAGKIARKK